MSFSINAITSKLMHHVITLLYIALFSLKKKIRFPSTKTWDWAARWCFYFSGGLANNYMIHQPLKIHTTSWNLTKKSLSKLQSAITKFQVPSNCLHGLLINKAWHQWFPLLVNPKMIIPQRVALPNCDSDRRRERKQPTNMVCHFHHWALMLSNAVYGWFLFSWDWCPMNGRTPEQN